MPRIRRSNKINKEATYMTNQPVPVQLSIVPGPETQKEIENTLDAPRRISEAIENFKKQRAEAEAELARSLAKDLAAGPLNVEIAIEKHKAWKAKDEAVAANSKTAEELQPMLEQRIQELGSTQPEVLKAAIQSKLEQLEKAAAEEKEKTALLKEQIDALKTRLQELNKQEHRATASTK
jgi:exonuclease V gamma subunit